MKLLPDLIDLSLFDAETAYYPTRTYKKSGNRISGYVDGKGAIEQAIEKLLSTERYSTPIYNGDYGVELEELIGLDINFVRADIKRRIVEALSEDNRVLEISNFVLTRQNFNELLVTFTVETVEGITDIERNFLI